MLRTHINRTHSRGSLHRPASNGLGLFSIDKVLINNMNLTALKMFLEHSGVIIVDNNKNPEISKFIAISDGLTKMCDESSLRQMAAERAKTSPFVLDTHFKRKQYWRHFIEVPKGWWRYPITDWSLHSVMIFNIQGLKCVVSEQRTDLYYGLSHGIGALNEDIGIEGIYLGLRDKTGSLTALTDALWVRGEDLSWRSFRERAAILETVSRFSGIPMPERDDLARKDFFTLDPNSAYHLMTGYAIVSGWFTPKVVLNRRGNPALFDEKGVLQKLRYGWDTNDASSEMHFAEVKTKKRKPSAYQEILNKTVFEALVHAKYANEYEFKRRLLKHGESTERAKDEINNRVHTERTDRP